MSNSNQRSDLIRQRIAASQARLDRDGVNPPAAPRRQQPADGSSPDGYLGLAAQYPWLTVAAGLGLGLLVGSLLPKGAGGKAGRRVMGAAAAAAELGLALSKQARDKASEGARDGLTMLEDSTAPLRERATSGAKSARDEGARLMSEAVKLASRLRR